MKIAWIGIIVGLAFGGVACNSLEKNKSVSILEDKNGNILTICEFSKINPDEISIKLSEITDSFKIVHFDNDVYFKFSSLSISDNYIGIIQENGPFLLYNHSGDFLCTVGNIGTGPGEYTWRPYDAIIDEKGKKVYLASFAFSNKILVYDLEGNYLDEIETKHRLNKPKIFLDKHGGLSIIHLPMGTNNGSTILASYFDKERIHQADYPAETKFLVKDFNQELFADHNTSNFSFHNTICDTLYHYIADKNVIYPKFTIDFGILDPKPIHIYNETSRFYIANIFDKGTVFVDKEDHSAKYTRVVNDYCGHMKYPQYAFKNGWTFRMFEPHQLIKWINKRLSDTSCSTNDRTELEKLLSSINEEGNNILFMGKLN